MKYLFLLLFLSVAVSVQAREAVVINNDTYTPEPKPKFDLNKALSAKSSEAKSQAEPTQIPERKAPPAPPQAQVQARQRPNVFTPQGKDRTASVMEAQEQSKRKRQAENIAAEAENSILNYENQYRKLGNLFYSRMLMEAENKVIEMQRKRVLDQRKFEEEMSIKTDTAEFENLMGLKLPGGAQPLPIIQQPEKKVEAPKPVRRDVDEQPPLRVVGIQGYRGKFTAQIMNQGGITNVAPGMDLDHGVHILSISEAGVKVRRSRQTETGETRSEVITLPLSR